MSGGDVVAAIILYMIVTAFIALVTEGEFAPHEYAWWPLAIAKWLLKGLWAILFTGWRS